MGSLNAIYGSFFLFFRGKENYNKLSEYRGQKWKSPLKAQEIYILIYKENIHLMAL